MQFGTGGRVCGATWVLARGRSEERRRLNSVLAGARHVGPPIPVGLRGKRLPPSRYSQFKVTCKFQITYKENLHYNVI